jgi:predicted nucleic acid-binding protein
MADYAVITDTSCLILLDNIQALDLLPAIYHNILTTPEIAAVDTGCCGEGHKLDLNV